MKKTDNRTKKRRRRPHHKIPFAKPGNQLYPIPAVMVSTLNPDTGKPNIFTVAWTGTICSDPPMVSISVRRERYSFGIIEKTGEFVINLTTEALAAAADFCGVRSGRDIDKFETLGLTPGKSCKVKAPAIDESPVSIECRVTQSIDLGSHVMFLAEVVCVQADEAYMDENNSFHLEYARPIAYSHGTYYALGQFGFSVMKDRTKKKKRRESAAKKKQKKSAAKMSRDASAGKPRFKHHAQNRKQNAHLTQKKHVGK
jgi:flavin reductase (DIM6/NTAB) family NADH-FMN oxidoreductase RutF